MRALFLLLVLSLCQSFIGTGQPAASSVLPDRSSVGLEAGFGFRSACITHELASDYFRHAFITDDVKDRVSKKLDARNAFAVDFGASLDYYHKLRSDSSRVHAWSLRVEDRHWIHSDFTRDVFEIYFRGNRSYKGKSADLSDFRFTNLHWQSVKGNLHLQLAGRHVLSLGAGIVRGQEFLDIRTRRGSLYTAPLGDYLDADLDLEIRQQDSAGTGFRSWNGTGGVVDIGWRHLTEEGSLFEVSVTDLGWIDFNGKSSWVPADTTYRFEGIDATELFDFSDTVRGSISSDSAFVQGFLTERKKERHALPLPGIVSVNWSKQWSDGQYGCTIEVVQRLFYATRPMARMEGNLRIGRQHRVHVNVLYGEYTWWTAGLGYTWTTGDWQVHAESRYLSAWLQPEGRCAGAFVTLRKYLAR
jgi:hypothetical protein